MWEEVILWYCFIWCCFRLCHFLWCRFLCFSDHCRFFFPYWLSSSLPLSWHVLSLLSVSCCSMTSTEVDSPVVSAEFDRAATGDLSVSADCSGRSAAVSQSPVLAARHASSCCRLQGHLVTTCPLLLQYLQIGTKNNLWVSLS